METLKTCMYQWGQTAASNGLTVPAAAEIIMEQWRNDNWQGRTKLLGVKPLQSHSVHYNCMWTTMVVNLGKKLVTDHLSEVMGH
jgi:hypothetical protein